MLEPIFCEGVSSFSLCYWAWRFAVAIALIFIGWILLMPKKKDR